MNSVRKICIAVYYSLRVCICVSVCVYLWPDISRQINGEGGGGVETITTGSVEQLTKWELYHVCLDNDTMISKTGLRETVIARRSLPLVRTSQSDLGLYRSPLIDET